MSDKRPHIKPEELAGLIRQYLAGELDDKAMHALERQALDDPFLADAIEGYAAHAPVQTVHQQELASRLSDRIATSTSRVRPMYYRWAAAAAILLLMFSAGWFLWEQQRKTPIAGIDVNKPVPQASPVFSEHGDTAPVKANNDEIRQAEADQQAETVKNDQLAQHTPPPAPAMAKVQPSKVAREQESNPVLSDAAADKAAPSAYKKTTDDTAGALLDQSKQKEEPSRNLIPPAQPRLKEEASRNFNSLPASKAAPALANRRQQQSILYPADSQKNHLNEVVVVGYGVQRKQSVTGSVTMIKAESIAKPPASDSQLLGEVAGVNVESSADEDAAYRAPAPVTGFTAFENYLKTKTVNPENKYSGTVRVSFVVMPDGSLQDFKILRHLNDACDAEAIRVIKEGPAWAPASDRKPTKVKVRVKFTVEKDK
jgi:TonB family protein